MWWFLILLAPVAVALGKEAVIAVAVSALVLTAVLTLRERTIEGLWEITFNPWYDKTN